MSSCVFCAVAAGEKTDQPIVAADEHTVAFLDARPVFKGHVLVIPACTSGRWLTCRRS